MVRVPGCADKALCGQRLDEPFGSVRVVGKTDRYPFTGLRKPLRDGRADPRDPPATSATLPRKSTGMTETSHIGTCLALGGVNQTF